MHTDTLTRNTCIFTLQTKLWRPVHTYGCRDVLSAQLRATGCNNNNNNSNNNNNNNNNTRTMFMVLTSGLCSRVIARVHPVHTMNAEQRQTAADLWTKPTDLSHRSACRQHITTRWGIITGPPSAKWQNFAYCHPIFIIFGTYTL